MFKERVYSVTKKIPKGKVSTYKAVASALNSKAYRAVGSALNKNTFTEVPCHRVINSDGSLGGFNAGQKKKIQMLKSEGIIIKNGQIDLDKFLYYPK